MNTLTGITLKQIQLLTKSASQDGLCIGHEYFFEGQRVEGMVQMPSLVAGRSITTIPKDGMPPRDLRFIRQDGGDEPVFEIEVLTELGAIFVELFLPRAA